MTIAEREGKKLYLVRDEHVECSCFYWFGKSGPSGLTDSGRLTKYSGIKSAKAAAVKAGWNVYEV